ncbi:MAG: rod shape-determining protein [Myxococcota bacterium]
MFNSVLGLFSQDMAIDLGTANTLVYVRGRGVVCNEPSVVAVHHDRRGNKSIVAVGANAKAMLGRCPADIQAIRPLKDGVIADFEITEAMIRHFIERVNGRRSFVAPRMVICIPYGTTDVEKRAVRESAESAGAREVHLIEEPLAAAIGADLPITEPTGNMIVDIGGGTTEVAVISMAGIVYSRSIKVGGDHMDEAIVQHMRRRHDLLVGPRTAEEIKLVLGSAASGERVEEMVVKGRDLVRGFPRQVTIHGDEVRDALEEPVQLIVDAIVGSLERTPPELLGDIIDRGIIMTGGGALLTRLDYVISQATGLPVIVADDPLSAVVKGSGRALEEMDLLRMVS